MGVKSPYLHLISPAVKTLYFRSLIHKPQSELQNLTGTAETLHQRHQGGIFPVQNPSYPLIKACVFFFGNGLIDIAQNGKLGLGKKHAENLIVQRSIILGFVNYHLADVLINAAAIYLQMQVENRRSIVKAQGIPL